MMRMKDERVHKKLSKDTQTGADQLEGPEVDGQMQWTGMRRECRNARTGETRQRAEMVGGGELKRRRNIDDYCIGN